MEYKPTIGLEIHAELLTKTKIFCNCKNEFGGEANSRVCPVCGGFPGALPVLSYEAVQLAVCAGLVLDCEIANEFSFDRKNYFYPDLPKGYQITQQFRPVCKSGKVVVGNKTFRINNIHLEEDAGKLFHIADQTLVDYNRCGVPLIEIVTEPDFSTSDEVVEFIEELALRLKYANVCDAKIEQGSLRVDVNVSVAEIGAETAGVRREIKNLGSLKSVKKAIEYEISEQIQILKSGERVPFQTRRFDENKGITLAMRKKESAKVYRYFPEPDIPPVTITDAEIDAVKNTLPIMPEARKKQYISEFKLSLEEAKNIVADKQFSDFYNVVCSKTKHYKKAAAVMLVGINRLINKYNITFSEKKLTPDNVAEITEMWGSGKLSSANAMDLIELVYNEGGRPCYVATKYEMIINFDENAAKETVINVLKNNVKVVSDYLKGNKKVFGFIMGQVMSALGKSADPSGVKLILTRCLEDADIISDITEAED